MIHLRIRLSSPFFYVLFTISLFSLAANDESSLSPPQSIRFYTPSFSRFRLVSHQPPFFSSAFVSNEGVICHLKSEPPDHRDAQYKSSAQFYSSAIQFKKRKKKKISSLPTVELLFFIQSSIMMPR